MSTLEEAKRRILALCPADQMPMVDFELRMLATSLEAESLNFIHQHWRPIADERNQLREQLAQVQAKPAKSAKPDTDSDVRLTALTIDHANLKRQHSNLQQKYDLLVEEKTDVQTELAVLQLAHKKLQADCDDLLTDSRPARERA